MHVDPARDQQRFVVDRRAPEHPVVPIRQVVRKGQRAFQAEHFARDEFERATTRSLPSGTSSTCARQVVGLGNAFVPLEEERTHGQRIPGGGVVRRDDLQIVSNHAAIADPRGRDDEAHRDGKHDPEAAVALRGGRLGHGTLESDDRAAFSTPVRRVRGAVRSGERCNR
ncbi:MAG: hypothetical protein R3B99_23790 [Polyangiales bacterium]